MLKKYFGRQTKLVSKFQESHYDIPETAGRCLVSDYRVRQTDFDNSDIVKCPHCGRKNDMTHGDRILCGCDYIMEALGNSLYIWHKSIGEGLDQFNYPYANDEDLALTLADRLRNDQYIRELSEKHPAINNALEELEMMIKLHENI